MARLLELTGPIQEREIASLESELRNLQGNILRGHGRDRSLHVVLRFAHDRDAAKSWLEAMAGRLTSAQQQLEDSASFSRYGIPGGPFWSVCLSAAGYTYLGLDVKRYSEIFQQGMWAASARLQDPVRRTWETGYQMAVHALVLMADNDEATLFREARVLLSQLNGIAEVCAVEHGRALRNGQGQHIEHFGYVDGRSQPLFFQRHVELEQSRDGIDAWDPSAPPNLVLVPDPHGAAVDLGSYVVFRKLEQNVQGFKAAEAALANELGLIGANRARAGALAVGRFEDGTPVVLHREPGQSPRPDATALVSNNFNFQLDLEGLKCPFHAHIRKVNPRGDLNLEAERRHRIVRRGMPYGERVQGRQDHPGLDELPSTGVGLLFMCYQQDLAEQFEFLQSRWANNVNFVRDANGVDPVIGRQEAQPPVVQQWPPQWNGPRAIHKPFNFESYVTLRGGEYFFAPSIRVLQQLG